MIYRVDGKVVTKAEYDAADAQNKANAAAPGATGGGGMVYRIDGKVVTKVEYDAADAQNKANAARGGGGGMVYTVGDKVVTKEEYAAAIADRDASLARIADHNTKVNAERALIAKYDRELEIWHNDQRARQAPLDAQYQADLAAYNAAAQSDMDISSLPVPRRQTAPYGEAPTKPETPLINNGVRRIHPGKPFAVVREVRRDAPAQAVTPEGKEIQGNRRLEAINNERAAVNRGSANANERLQAERNLEIDYGDSVVTGERAGQGRQTIRDAESTALIEANDQPSRLSARAEAAGVPIGRDVRSERLVDPQPAVAEAAVEQGQDAAGAADVGQDPRCAHGPKSSSTQSAASGSGAGARADPFP